MLTSNESHTYNGITSTLATTSTYDRMGKKLTQEVTADGQTAATAVNTYDYDDLNRLSNKKYGDLAETMAYNLQGWLASMNSDKFTQTLAYSYNGNINSVNWTQSGKPAAAYNLAYDAQNRLTAATGNAFEEKGISYDRNGNIKTLQRTANNTAKDDIAYQYSGNQLNSVTGNLASTYTYDNNGNLKTDSRKSLEFSYNYLNLLQTVGTTNYTYAADGTKLSVKEGSNGFDYLGSLILSNSSTEFQFSDGVINKTTGGYAVNYFLRDHLGSVRTVVDKDKNILQQSDYYPFGLKQERANYVNNSNRFLYNGKELQTTGDLGVLDYGARMYDGVRWLTMDPMAEEFYGISPYAYCNNSPTNTIDPDGRFPVILVPIIKGAVGAVVDAAAQVSVAMSNGKNFGEAMSNIDYTSVGASFVASALVAPGMSTAAKAITIATVAVDAAIDVEATDGVRSVVGIVGKEKPVGRIAIDAVASIVPGKAVDNITSGFNRAVASDLTSATISKETKSGLKQMQATANGVAVQTGANAVADYTGGVVGGKASNLISTTKKISVAKQTPYTQPADATRLQKNIIYPKYTK